MPDAQLPGARLRYETAGDEGTPVILVMGFSMPGHAWRFQVPAFAEHHRVVSFDNRGAGESEVPPGPYSMTQLAGDAVALMDHLGWESAHVVGVSMGGMVAQHIALDHRERVRSLTLIVTHPGGSIRTRLPRPAGIMGFARTMTAKKPERIKALVRLLFPKAYRAKVGEEKLREILGRDLAKPPSKAGRRGQLRAVIGHTTVGRLGELADVSTLVIRAGEDLLVNPRGSDILHAKIPNSALLRIPDAGHGIIRMSADTINPAMLRHFAAADMARAGA
ncbi:MAG: pimeloyl-ACP methyl ester carboxylesterase [Myxococcota bacterium]|jgi:pimeloyl-ACP methyl ester carboxylesterase